VTILFKYPSRGRPDRFFHGMDSIYNNLADTDNFLVSCTLDSDDMEMNNPETILRINQYKNATIAWGESKSKIHAVNRDFPNTHFDIIVGMSDDMRFNLFGFDDCIRADMRAHFPARDGLLHYPDQDAKHVLATMYIAGKKWWEFRDKCIYHPSYKSLFCDNEEHEVAEQLGRYHYCGYQINIHLNPAYGHLERDELFNQQQAIGWTEDQENYNYRKSNNYFL
jgi:hypothetical protein